METKEFQFKGLVLNGIMMLILTLLAAFGGIALIIYAAVYEIVWPAVVGGLLLICSIISCCGFMQIEPGEARVLMFFGKYRGTHTEAGFHWVNPFYVTKKLSLRARNLDAEPIKVNDKTGNPVMIGLVLVWKLKDTYKAMFEVDVQTMAAGRNGQNIGAVNASMMMNALENFVRRQ